MRFSCVPVTHSIQCHFVCFLVNDWLIEPIVLNAPTLLVTIDYNKLNTPRNSFTIERVANVALAMDNDTDIVRRTSRFLPAVPGTHILAAVRYNIRRISLDTNVFFWYLSREIEIVLCCGLLSRLIVSRRPTRMSSSPSWVSTVRQHSIVSRIDISNIDYVGVDPFVGVSPDDNSVSLRQV